MTSGKESAIENQSSTDYGAVLQNPQFRTLWLSSLFALVAWSISQVALPIFVYALTGSAATMGVILVIQLIPRALLSPFAGVLADTFNRKWLLVASSAIQAIGVAMLPIASEVWHVAVLSVLIGMGSVLYIPAEMATVPTIVEPHQLVTALSAVQVASSITRVIGPAIGAGLIAMSGTDLAFTVQAGMFLIAIAILMRLELPPVEPIPEASHARTFTRYLVREARDGLRIVWRIPIVRAICTTECLWSLALATLSISAVVFVNEELDLGDRASLVYGLLAATLSAGAVIGALIARQIDRRGGRITLLLVGYLAPLALVPVFLTPPLPVLFLCWFVVGFADAWLVIAMYAYVIESVPANARGRVFAIWGGLMSVASLGTFALVGWLTEHLGPQTTFLIAGLTVAIGSPLVLWLSGALASIRSSPAVLPGEAI